jgi:hypothetical protein
VYHSYDGEYTAQCTDLIEYATTDPHRDCLLPGFWRYENPVYAIPCRNIAPLISDLIPHITALHFVLIDCAATFRPWDAFPGLVAVPYKRNLHFPLSLIELHITFAYTSPPPKLLLDAPRGTFFPPPWPHEEIPRRCWFDGVRRLVVREANADFVAFLTTRCPLLERIESTAEFCVEDVPHDLSEDEKAKLAFVRLPRTTTWPGLTGGDTAPIPEHSRQTLDDWYHSGLTRPAVRPVPPLMHPSIPTQKKRNFIWRRLKRAFRERK